MNCKANDPPEKEETQTEQKVQLEKLHGAVEHVVYQNEDTGFTVLELSSGDTLTTVVGSLLGVAEGEEVELTGSYAFHPTYGQQFKVELFERKLPATAAAIQKYLSSGAIKGIGPRTAGRIVAAFGDDALNIMEKEPHRLGEVAGISKKKAAEIAESYQRIFGIRTVMLELARFDIEPAAAIRAWKQWGQLAAELIRENPYQLCCPAVGVPFEKADSIAFALQIGQETPARLQAGILHVLTHNLRNGHTCLPQDKLIETAAGLLEVDGYLLEDALQSAVEDNTLVSDTLAGQRFVYLPEYYEAETYIAGRISMMLRITPPDPGSFEKEIDAQESAQNIQYASLQRKAISMALANNLFILTGGPGTGKTTTLNALLSILEENGEKVALAAPTGRAAKRMSEVTGREAATIHRLLEVDFRDGRDSKLKFKRNEKNPLRVDTIILDEVSMVDTQLLSSLFCAMKISCRIVLVGDPDQLPSVGAGNILKDLIDSDMVPTVHLNEIFRQAEQSHIVRNAHRIVNGEAPDLEVRDNDFFFLTKSSYQRIAQTVCDLCATRLPKAYGYSPLWDIQVVAPSRIGALGTVELNKMLQQRLNPPDGAKVEQKFGTVFFREQDKVMQVKNNYDILWKKEDGEQGSGVFNGDIGVIEMIDRPSRTLLVRYDDRVAEYTFEMAEQLEHAYAVTVHKSQGSEFEAVIMPLMNYHQKLYYRNILYTAVTRAKKMLILLGQPDTVYMMAANDRKILRYTGLRHLLKDSLDAMGQNGI